MADPLSSAHAIVRAALLKIDPTRSLEAVDTLDLRAHAKVSAVVGVPLRRLQQNRDVEGFATSAPIAAVKGLLELLAVSPLEKTIELLGEHAESPTFEQLRDAIDQLQRDGATKDDVVAVLAYAVGESYPAAAHCRRLFEERADLALPELPHIAAPSVLAPPREVSGEVREQRKLRREEERRRKRAGSASRPPRPTKAKGGPARPHVVLSPTPVVALPPETRRSLPLTPFERERFDSEHPLVGSVVLAEVPFDAVDPAQPEVTSKERPVLVVAASRDELLVRALYSNDAPTRSIFGPWRRVGLEHVSYVDDVRVVLALRDRDALVSLGQLTTTEWNALV